MARVTRPGGVVAAAVWNHASSAGPLSLFWGVVRDVDPQAEGEGDFAGVREGDLARLFVAAGLDSLEESTLTVHVPFDSFEQWWEPYTMGVGPAGQYVAGLDRPGWTRSRRRAADGFRRARSPWTRHPGASPPPSPAPDEVPGATLMTTFPIFWPLPAYRWASAISAKG